MSLFHFLGSVLHGDSKPGGGVFGFLNNQLLPQSEAGKRKRNFTTPATKFAINNAKVTAQYIARTPETLGRSAIDPFFAGDQSEKSVSGFKKSLYGSPAQTYQSRIHGNQEKGGLIGAAALPLGIAGAVLDVSGAGQLKNLAKATTVQAVRKLLPGIEHSKALAIANNKDPHVIQNILDGKSPTPRQTLADVVVPTPLKPTEGGAGQGIGESPIQHLETIRNAQSTTPELKQAILGMKQSDKIRSTQKLSDDAKQVVDKDYTGALTKVLTTEKPSDKDIAVAAHIIVKAQQENRIGEAVNVAEETANKLRESGRTVQAGSIIGRLSPEGQLLYATRQLRKARESNPKNIAREKQTAQEIQTELEKPLERKTVSSVVKNIARGKKEPESVGEQVAKNISREVSPRIKQKADELVKELTKKIKQEQLEPKTKTPKSPTDILKEVFGRSDEAKAAYPEAQRILREKFADNEKVLEKLDNFFGSKLDLPAASSTINRSIQEQLKKNSERVSDIIYKSHVEQGQSVDDVAKALTAEGFDKQGAKILAKEATDRLNTQVTSAKRSVLERLSQETKSRNQPTFVEKINKLSNLGALESHDYTQLARAKLNLPHLTVQGAEDISRLSQKLQGLPEGHEKYAITRQIEERIRQEVPLTKTDIIKGIPGLMRSIVVSGDLSFGGRQGLLYMVSHPVRFAKAWPKQFTYFKEAFKGDEHEAFDAMMADIHTHPDAGLLSKVERELGITEPKGHSAAKREEQFIGSDLASRIPGIKNLVQGSNYAYTGLGNYLKANQFYSQVAAARFANRELDEEFLKKTAKVISNSLGRGDLGRFERYAGELSTGLFAPRLIASRVNMMDPRYYINLPKEARHEALRQLIGLSVFAGGVLGAAKLAGLDVNLDPRNADFAKIRYKDTRFDVLGGFTQYLRFGTQMITGQKINSTTGAQTEAGKGFAGSRFDILANFFENKSAPAPNLAITLLKGKDISGDSIYTPKGIGSQIAQRFIPLVDQDMADLFTHPQSANKILSGALAGSGIGLQTYGIQDLPLTEKQKGLLDILKQKGVSSQEIAANKSFYQTVKAASGKNQNISNEINLNLSKGNIDKAKSLADEYNRNLIEGMKPWATKDNIRYLSEDLAKALKKELIELDEQSIKSRLKGILENPKKYNLKIGGQ